MTVWEFKPGNVNDYAPLVFTSDTDIDSGMFDGDGKPLAWKKKPQVEVFVEPGKKKALPVADISVLTPGALVLSEKAKAAMETVLSRFGQFLEMDCRGEVRWFYNVTNVVDCIDEKRSTKRSGGSISKEKFLEDKLPAEAAVFKDPLIGLGRVGIWQLNLAEVPSNVAVEIVLGSCVIEVAHVLPCGPRAEARSVSRVGAPPRAANSDLRWRYATGVAPHNLLTAQRSRCFSP